MSSCTIIVEFIYSVHIDSLSLEYMYYLLRQHLDLCYLLSINKYIFQIGLVILFLGIFIHHLIVLHPLFVIGTYTGLHFNKASTHSGTSFPQWLYQLPS